MWFLVIVAGNVLLIAAWTQAERVRRTGHPALGSFTESAGLPVSVAFLWVALELALHDAVWTAMAWQILTFLLVYAVFAVRRSLRRRRNTA
jgi:hypothetical protein